MAALLITGLSACTSTSPNDTITPTAGDPPAGTSQTADTPAAPENTQPSESAQPPASTADPAADEEPSLVAEADRSAGAAVIQAFFDLYANKDYAGMQALLYSENVLENIDTIATEGIYGMAQATLTSCELQDYWSYNEELGYQDTLVYQCGFQMVPAANSVYGPEETEAYCLIDLKQLAGEWKISAFHSGI